ncbi:MAG TPA: hypothetical protein VHW25_11160 [Steroidobacteraceae bacterium]|jgi:ElaB/YqjD/DUF883 family membrane-anchored ribosome-binding protein|nr:hypothetical protein [Steroidobacteraceae bacterium]
MIEQDTAGADAMAAELRRIIEQAEQLLDAAGVDNPTLAALKDRVNDTVEAARDKLAELEQEARRRGRRAAAATESWVQTNPWAALAIGAGVGLLIGALIMRGSPAPSPELDEPEA